MCKLILINILDDKKIYHLLVGVESTINKNVLTLQTHETVPKHSVMTNPFLLKHPLR